MATNDRQKKVTKKQTIKDNKFCSEVSFSYSHTVILCKIAAAPPPSLFPHSATSFELFASCLPPRPTIFHFLAFHFNENVWICTYTSRIGLLHTHIHILICTYSSYVTYHISYFECWRTFFPLPASFCMGGIHVPNYGLLTQSLIPAKQLYEGFNSHKSFTG